MGRFYSVINYVEPADLNMRPFWSRSVWSFSRQKIVPCKGGSVGTVCFMVELWTKVLGMAPHRHYLVILSVTVTLTMTVDCDYKYECDCDTDCEDDYDTEL